jgi:AcrR family transcriptional regulator
MSEQEEASPASGGRHARRREQTRRKLLDAARALFARQGVDNTRINEITDEADVGFGSFYNHFASKEAIVEAVLAETVAGQGAAVDAVTHDLEDPAERVAAAHRYFVRLARSDPDWAWLLVRLDLSQVVALASLGPFASGGALLGVMRDVLDGQAPRDADRHHAEGILRMFGVPAEEAAAVARRPMPRGFARPS